MKLFFSAYEVNDVISKVTQTNQYSSDLCKIFRETLTETFTFSSKERFPIVNFNVETSLKNRDTDLQRVFENSKTALFFADAVCTALNQRQENVWKCSSTSLCRVRRTTSTRITFFLFYFQPSPFYDSLLRQILIDFYGPTNVVEIQKSVEIIKPRVDDKRQEDNDDEGWTVVGKKKNF